MAWARWWLRTRFAVAMSWTTTTPWDVASLAVSWWSLLVRTAPTRACARPRRSRALARLAEAFLGPRQGALQVPQVGQGVPQGAGGFQGRHQRAGGGGHDRGGLDPDVHPHRGTRRPAVRPRCWRRGG